MGNEISHILMEDDRHELHDWERMNIFPKKKIDNSMIKCDSCETYTHESLIVKKLGRNYCSESCSST